MKYIKLVGVHYDQGQTYFFDLLIPVNSIVAVQSIIDKGSNTGVPPEANSVLFLGSDHWYYVTHPLNSLENELNR